MKFSRIFLFMILKKQFNYSKKNYFSQVISFYDFKKITSFFKNKIFSVNFFTKYFKKNASLIRKIFSSNIYPRNLFQNSRIEYFSQLFSPYFLYYNCNPILHISCIPDAIQFAVNRREPYSYAHRVCSE